MSFVDYGTSDTSLGILGAEGVCDISGYVPPEEEVALSLSCQASSVKGMNW